MKAHRPRRADRALGRGRACYLGSLVPTRSVGTHVSTLRVAPALSPGRGSEVRRPTPAHDAESEYDRYARSLAELGLADLNDETLTGPPELEADDDHFRATADVKLPDGGRQRWHIREESRVWSDR